MKCTLLACVCSVLALVTLGAIPVYADTPPTPPPTLDVLTGRLAVGRDGLVYLASGEYVLRIGRDGKGKAGSKVTAATWNVAANKDGVIATANAHFNHCVTLWNPKFEKLGAVADFLSSDETEWWGPCDVQAGASGDFYGVDQNRSRIIRVKVPGENLASYPMAATGEDFKKQLLRFRVWEKGRRFYICSSNTGTIYALNFSGDLDWKLNTRIGGNPWDGYAGAFDIDDDGNLYLILANSNLVVRYGPDGNPAGRITLDMSNRPDPITDLRIFGDDLLIKRKNAVELFQVYVRLTGAWKRTVLADGKVVQ